MTDIVPFLGYEDCGAAADWLVRAFGVEEVERFEGNGEVGHVTLRSGSGLVFLGHPDGYLNPLHLPEQSEPAAPHGRLSRLEDPEGHRWMLQERARYATSPTNPG
jgi:uncharacterized glyoxalase superfamily protein PhnB